MQKQFQELVVSDPKVMMGKPAIIGTRITVELILEKLAAGETPEQILESHPRLTREAIQAALAFAAEALRYDVIICNSLVNYYSTGAIASLEF